MPFSLGFDQFKHVFKLNTQRDDELQVLVAEHKSILQYSSGMRHMKCAKFAWTKRVKFPDAIVTDVFEQTATLSADISSLYYTQNDYKRCAFCCVNVKSTDTFITGKRDTPFNNFEYFVLNTNKCHV